MLCHKGGVCDTHEIQGKSRELLGIGIKVILTYIIVIMGSCMCGIPLWVVGMWYIMQPLKNPNVL